jgi:hypothetical protein
MPGYQASKDGGLRGIAGVGIDKLCGKCWWGNSSVWSSSERLVHRIRPNRGPYRRDLRRLPREPRLELDLWELLELCDSPGRGRTIAVGQMAYLQTDTLLFAAVVTSGVSHRDRGVHMTPVGAAGAVRQPGPRSDDCGGSDVLFAS